MQESGRDRTQKLFDGTSRALEKLTGSVDEGFLTKTERPEWLNKLGEQLKERAETNSLKACIHLALVRQPPFCVLAWLPEIVLCERCAKDNRYAPQMTEELECDGCGKHVPREIGIRSTVIRLNPSALLFAGVCNECAKALTK